ncbi:MAG TPA: peptide permease, partial [Lachnospiraceae bacterium]|nr:peptide permease [Lachnospiraceae bacterium]
DFWIMTLIGNPIEIMSGGPRVSKVMLQRRAETLGLNKPIIVQYFSWLGQVLHGNL